VEMEEPRYGRGLLAQGEEMGREAQDRVQRSSIRRTREQGERRGFGLREVPCGGW
jgi:hypothetical protein